ncbi:hypothetical protein L914_21508 [Phytophthora nicotianae]|uniref:Uncharacterized protein n=2 Tax=Phytophthora nicotianae TaxID=4792 RepID=V9DVH6_PHYNI|nr:hypothetical protein F443_22875 [Phytophthora nicotianae P1569]ETM30816.1 hypothetical protein L914_21508 [Phytophthora nicotianae]
MVENEPSRDLAEAVSADAGKLLRRVEADAELEEERSWKQFGPWLKKQIPLTAGWKEARKVKKAQKHLNRFRSDRENKKASIGREMWI